MRAQLTSSPRAPRPGYQIAYRLASSSPNTFTTVEVGATVRQFTATELAPESAYVFRLSAKTRQGWGEPLEATVITTEKRGKTGRPNSLPGRGRGGHACLGRVAARTARSLSTAEPTWSWTHSGSHSPALAPGWALRPDPPRSKDRELFSSPAIPELPAGSPTRTRASQHFRCTGSSRAEFLPQAAQSRRPCFLPSSLDSVQPL